MCGRMSPESAPLEASTNALKRGWAFLESFDVPTESVRDRSAVFVRETERSGELSGVYVKIYANKLHPFQRLFRKGRCQNEVRNLLFFKSVGIETPEIVAWGERRNLIGRIVEEFIITATVEHSLQLDTFVDQHCAGPTDENHKLIRMRIACLMGEWTAAMHAGNFIHEDQKTQRLCRTRQSRSLEVFEG